MQHDFRLWPHRSGRYALSVAAILVFGISFTAFAPVLDNGFLPYDDFEYVIDNANIRGLSWRNIVAAFSNTYVLNYAPLHILSYGLDYSLFGLNPVAFHAHNLILHAVNAVLLMFLVRSLSGNGLVSAAAALFFALHPLQVESVAWIAERKNVLSTAFLLGSMLTYIRFTQKGSPSSYVASLALFVAALLSKSVVVVFPLLLCSYILLHGKPRLRQLAPTVPFFILAAAFSALTVFTQQKAIVGYHGGSPLSTALTMTCVITDYLKLVLLLKPQSPSYDPTIHTQLSLPVVLSMLLLVALLSIVWLHRKNPNVLFWTSWIAITLLPVMQIIPLITLMNDRYLYLPLIGIGALVIMGTNALLRRRAWLLGTPLLILLFGLTFQRSDLWKETTLWEDAIRHYPSHADLHLHLAIEHHWSGRSKPALPATIRAIELNPRILEARQLHGTLLLELQRYDEALRELQIAYDGGLRNEVLLSNLGYAHMDVGDASTGLKYQQEALAMNPHYANAIYGVALAFEELGKLEHAAEYWQRFLDDTPPNNPWRLQAQQHLQAIRTQGQPHESKRIQAPAARLEATDRK